MTETQKYGWSVKIAALLIITIEYFTSLVTPALGVMNKAFAAQGVDAALVKQIQSLPNLTMIIMGLLVPVLLKKFTKRQLLFFAIILIFIGGVAPAFGGSIYIVLMWRAILGLGRGILFPFATSFIIELWQGKERDFLVGLRSSAGAFAGVVLQQIGGLLAAWYWRNTFFGYLIMIPIAIYIYIKLPEPPKDAVSEENAAAVAAMEGKPKFTGLTWFMIIINMIMMVATYTWMTNIGIVMTTLQIGGPSATANVMSTFTLAMFVSGLIFGKFTRPLLKKFATGFGVLLLGLGLTVAYTGSQSGSLAALFLAAILFGFGFQIYNADMYINVGISSPGISASAIIAFYMGFNGFGQFASNLVIDPLAKGLGFTSVLGGWQVGGTALLVGGIIVIIYKAFRKAPKAA